MSVGDIAISYSGCAGRRVSIKGDQCFGDAMFVDGILDAISGVVHIIHRIFEKSLSVSFGYSFDVFGLIAEIIDFYFGGWHSNVYLISIKIVFVIFNFECKIDIVIRFASYDCMFISWFND